MENRVIRLVNCDAGEHKEVIFYTIISKGIETF